MSIQNYPPLIESKLPAFGIINDATQIIINVPYVLNKAVSLNDFDSMVMRIKTVTTGTEKLNIISSSCHSLDVNTKSRYARFVITGDNLTVFNPNAGSYYKIQLAFKKNGHEEEPDIQSPWSSVGVIKCTTIPTVIIKNLSAGSDNINPTLYVGQYENNDVTEKVYSYNFIIKDENDDIYDTSGDIIHNGVNDENISGIGVQSTMQWKPYKSLQDGHQYTITFSVTTINNYTKTSVAYIVKVGDTIDANIPARLLATPDYDNGCVQLSLIKRATDTVEMPFTGNFVISRYSQNTNTWNEMCRFNTLSQTPSSIGIIYTDYTLEHGVKYLYALQAYNKNELYSNRLYHIIPNPNILSPIPYLEYDDNGNPYYITGDFTDMFLTDETRQLKIKFNPKVSSYKSTILESKVETIGSKYPFIFRSGHVDYKEFPISGLLSYLMDEKELFMSGIMPIENTMQRTMTSAAAGSQSRSDWSISSDGSAKLTSDNFYRERLFKTAALDWLNNGKPKLFRSPGEGNFIIRLMNTSLTPNDTLGRMLHTFNTTAYEIDECNFMNLDKYKLLSIPTIDNRIMKFNSVNLREVSQGTDWKYEPGYAMYKARIVGASPGSQFEFAFNGIAQSDTSTYEIGSTGTYQIEPDDGMALTSVQLLNSVQHNDSAILEYGYYDTSIPDYFSYISNITTRTEASQIIGYDDEINVIPAKLEDIRRQVSHFYSIIINSRPVYDIYYNAIDGLYYADPYYSLEFNQWSDLAIYHDFISGNYYSGNPNVDGSSLGTTAPEKYFKFNNTYILDLETGNAYETSDPLYDMPENNEVARKYFIALTNGRYQITSNFNKITSLHLSPGVYVDLAYELKETEYTVENTDDEVIAAKEAWKNAEKTYQENPTLGNKNALFIAYTNYLTILDTAIQLSAQEEYYVL